MYTSFYWNLAAGATIVLVETLLFALALLLGPRTGLVYRHAPCVQTAGHHTGERP